MRNLFYVIVFCCVLAGSFSCAKKKENILRGEARELYIESQRITNLYLDSMSKAKDSTNLLGLCKRYDEAITSLNYEHKAGADYEISEGENDTLTNLNDRFVTLRDSLLYSYAHNSIKPDSLSADSIAIP